MKAAIIGCGSLGLLWASRISKTDYELVLFTRTEEQKQSINKNGIAVINIEGRSEHYHASAEVVTSYPCNKPFDVVFVAVKQTHLCELIPVIQSITNPESQILFIQNGLGHEEKIKCLFQREWTYAMITMEGAFRSSSYEVHHTGQGDIWVGRLPNDSSSFHPKVHLFIQSLNGLGEFEIRRDGAIVRRIWEKLLINCVINPLTAVYEVQNGELLSPRYSEKIDRVVYEAISVAEKAGLSFTATDIKGKVYETCRKTHLNFSSTAQDIRRGVPTEIDYLNGALVRWGKRMGVNTRYNEQLLDQVAKLEVGNGYKGNKSDS